MIDKNQTPVDKVGNEIPNPDQHQAHGMTHAEIAELQRRQLPGHRSRGGDPAVQAGDGARGVGGSLPGE